jgi:hypothetical protein
MPTIAFGANLLAILTGFVWLIVFAWLVSIVLTLYGLSRQKPLLPTNHLRMTRSDAPLVSVLVPARNEQHRVLADCIRSILAQDYGRFEVIAVNDRSTDATERYWKHSPKAMTACMSLKAKNRLPDGLANPTLCSKPSITHAASGYWRRMPT